MTPDEPGDSGASAFADLDRPPLDAGALRRSLVRDGSPWTSVTVRSSIGSTHTDLVEAARSGAASAGAILVAEEQTAGRGRLSRTWQSPARAGLTLSVLLAPAVPVASWGWLPLLAGLAIVDGVAVATELDTTLKWPNDVLTVGGRKLAGVLAERVDVVGVPHAVLGLGLNVSTRAEELAVETATSLRLAGVEHPDRQTVLVAVLRALAVRLDTWEDEADITTDYRAACSTLGREVSVERPARPPLRGTAVDLDDEGRLVVADASGSRTAVAAGDITHLR